jgi:hypothetical protein
LDGFLFEGKLLLNFPDYLTIECLKMPSIALFIRDLLSEDKYSPDFINRIEERIRGLNAAQLHGMYIHLKATSRDAKSDFWKEANTELMEKIEGILKIKMEEVNKEKKVFEEFYLKQRHKRQQAKVGAHEKIRVMEMIDIQANQQAETEIKENELKRQAAERLVILQETMKGEEKRNFWWKILAGFYLLAVAAVSYVMRQTLLICIPAVIGLTLICVFLAYRCHLWTEVKPLVVTDAQLQLLIEAKTEILKKQAIMGIKERERKFQEQQRREHIERKKSRKARKEKQRQDIEMIEKERYERIAQAKMLLAESLQQDENDYEEEKEEEERQRMTPVDLLKLNQSYQTNIHLLQNTAPLSPLSDEEELLELPIKFKQAPKGITPSDLDKKKKRRQLKFIVPEITPVCSTDDHHPSSHHNTETMSSITNTMTSDSFADDDDDMNVADGKDGKQGSFARKQNNNHHHQEESESDNDHMKDIHEERERERERQLSHEWIVHDYASTTDDDVDDNDHEPEENEEGDHDIENHRKRRSEQHPQTDSNDMNDHQKENNFHRKPENQGNDLELFARNEEIV